MCLCSLVACWFPSIAYKISLLQDIGQFCIRNPGLFLNHADHLYTFSLLYICILETLPLLLFFLIMPCTLDCLIDTHVYISGWLDRFSRCKKIESYGRVFFFNRNINSRLRVGFENFWRCFNKTKEKKQEPGDEHPHARRTQQSIFVIKEMFRKTEPHKKNECNISEWQGSISKTVARVCVVSWLRCGCTDGRSDPNEQR